MPEQSQPHSVHDLVRYLRGYEAREGAGRGTVRRVERLHAWADAVESLEEQLETMRGALALAEEVVDAYGRHFRKDERYYAFRDVLATLPSNPASKPKEDA